MCREKALWHFIQISDNPIYLELAGQQVSHILS